MAPPASPSATPAALLAAVAVVALVAVAQRSGASAEVRDGPALLAASQGRHVTSIVHTTLNASPAKNPV